MVFAAGFGTRMGALTRDLPKPLLEVAGRSLLDRAIGHLRDAGIARIVVNAHYHADRIVAHLAGQPDVTVITETPEVLETGGGLRNALPLLGAGPVLTLNPDALFLGPNPVPELLARWRGDTDAMLLLVPRDKTHAHAGPGDFDLSEGRLSRRGGAAASHVYTGLQVIRPDGLSKIPERAFSLNLLWDDMLGGTGLGGCVYSGAWVDVGTPQGLTEAGRLIAEGRDVSGR